MGFERDEVPSQGAGAAPLPGRDSAQIPFHAIFAAGKRAHVYTKEPQNGFRKGRSPFAGCRGGASAGSRQRPDTLPRDFCRRQKSSCIHQGTPKWVSKGTKSLRRVQGRRLCRVGAAPRYPSTRFLPQAKELVHPQGSLFTSIPFFLRGRHCCLPLFVCKPSLTSLLPAAAASPSLSSVFKNAFYIF